jgi:hypothetical protein
MNDFNSRIADVIADSIEEQEHLVLSCRFTGAGQSISFE